MTYETTARISGEDHVTKPDTWTLYPSTASQLGVVGESDELRVQSDGEKAPKVPSWRRLAAAVMTGATLAGGGVVAINHFLVPRPAEISTPANQLPDKDSVVEVAPNAVEEYLSSENRRDVLREQLVFTGTRVVDAINKGDLQSSMVDLSTFKSIDKKDKFTGTVVLAGEKNGVSFVVQTYMKNGVISVEPVGMDYVELDVIKPTSKKDAGAVLCTPDAVRFHDETDNGIGAIVLNTGLGAEVDKENAQDPTLDETYDPFSSAFSAHTTEEAQDTDDIARRTMDTLLGKLLPEAR